MPIYEFVCQQCGHEFERIQSFSDTSTPVCPHCAAVEVDRQVSRPAIHFKGSGWYITDSKEKSKKPSKESANGSSSDVSTDKSDSGKDDSNTSTPSKSGADTKSSSAETKTTAAAAD